VGECVCMRERDGVFLCLCLYVLVHVFEGGVDRWVHHRRRLYVTIDCQFAFH